MDELYRSIKQVNSSNLLHLAASCEGHWTAASFKHSKNQIIIIYVELFLNLGEEKKTMLLTGLLWHFFSSLEYPGIVKSQFFSEQ